MTKYIKNAEVLNGYSRLRNAFIVSTGIYLPKQRVKSLDLMKEIESEKFFGVSENWLDVNAGIVERRFASESDTPASMAIKSAENALEASRIDPKQIDKIVFCGIDREYAEPATAHIINHRLGLKATDCYDIADACYGFVRGIQDCVRSISLGETDYALIVTGKPRAE